MWRAIKFLFSGDWHAHKFQIIRALTVSNSRNEVIGTEYVLQCKHCGNIKRKRFM